MMDSNAKPKPKGRPLLVAAVGVAFVSFTQCEPKAQDPMGNLRPPQYDRDSGMGQSMTDPSAALDAGAAAPTTPTATAPTSTSTPIATPDQPADAGAIADAGVMKDPGGHKKKRDAGAPLSPIIPPLNRPVGNLRADE
jgi:hypothetical protein